MPPARPSTTSGSASARSTRSPRPRPRPAPPSSPGPAGRRAGRPARGAETASWLGTRDEARPMDTQSLAEPVTDPLAVPVGRLYRISPEVYRGMVEHGLLTDRDKVAF